MLKQTLRQDFYEKKFILILLYFLRHKVSADRQNNSASLNIINSRSISMSRRAVLNRHRSGNNYTEFESEVLPFCRANIQAQEFRDHIPNVREQKFAAPRWSK